MNFIDNIVLRSFSLTILAIASFACHSFALAEEIVFVNDATPYCPYTICNDGKEGYVIDVVKTIFQNRGYTVTIKNQPWNRALATVDAGKANGILAVTKSAAPNLIYPRHEIATYIPAVFSLSDKSWNYENVDSLKKVRLGLIQNYGNGEGNPELEKYLNSKSSKISYIAAQDGDLHLFLMIEAEHIDAMIEDQLVGNYILDQMGKKNLFKSVRIQQNYIYGYIGFSSKDKAPQKLADIFDEDIVKLRKSGQLKHILDVYGLSDWER